MSADSPPVSAPRWARAADLLFLFLLLLAVVVAAFGGFRMRVGDIRVSLTTPERIVLWAIAVAVLRHVFERRAPIYKDLPARLRSTWRLREVRAALVTLISTRVAVLFVGYMAVFMFGYFNNRPPFRVDENEVLNLQARWDTGWYLGIAVNEYSYEPELAQEQQNIVFFPALPVAMRIVGRLLGGSTPAFLLGGTLIVLLAFLWALVYLYRFARDVLGDDDRAQYALWLLAAYPFAVFYSSVYTESLFLLGAIGAFYHFRRGELLRAGLFGLLVGLTRPNGCFLSIPLGLLAIAPWLPPWLTGGPEGNRPRDPLRLVKDLAAAAMPGVGVLMYSAFIWRLTGDPLAWAAGHIAWGRS
ncbi:MAG: mannosyltransferase family protein, partial [Vicinamibacterales bacterium]